MLLLVQNKVKVHQSYIRVSLGQKVKENPKAIVAIAAYKPGA